MADEFDPYREWLNVVTDERPVDHYRLLGLPLLEGNPAVIRAAAEQRMTLVQTFAAGPHAEVAQRLLNDLAAAKLCLLNAETKAAYDSRLMTRTSPRASPVAGGGSPVLVSPAPTGIADDQESVHSAVWFLSLLAVGVFFVVVLALAVLVALTHKPGGGRPPVRPGPTTPPAAPPPSVEDEPPLVFPVGRGEFHLEPARAILLGGVERSEGTESVLRQWSGPDATARWRFKTRDAGRYRARIRYALSDDVQGAGYVLEIDGAAPKQCDVSARGGPGRFKEDELEVWIGRKGEHILTFRLDPSTSSAPLLLRSIHLSRK